MLYGLKVIEEHPCFKMQELLSNLFFDYALGYPFNDSIFPNNFSKEYIKGQGGGFKKSIEEIIGKLPKDDIKRKDIYSQFVNNNSVEALCLEKTFIPEDKIKWNLKVGKELNDFLLSCYQSKLDLSVFRKEGCKEKPTHSFYNDFILSNGNICPFCGLNSYKNRFGSRREDLDHYLYKGEYPLAAVNMWNLVPTCTECNQDYKKTINVLYDGKRRTEAYYPYGSVGGIKVKVRIKPGSDSKQPNSWDIIIDPNNTSELEKVENWKRVYGITKRYQNDIAEYHDNWIMAALLDRTEKFKDLYSFRRFMMSKAKYHKKLFIRKLEPKSLLKTSFFVFLARYADDAFIGKYMISFNSNP
ncbi:TPA: hypothetical protein ACPVXX_004849 [Vibrio parahaemolyticus]